jgi:hypothetical protein
VCSRTYTRRRRQLALPAFIAPSVPRRGRLPSGDVPSRVSRSLRKQAHSKPRCRVRLHRKSTANARRSPSSRTPGLKSDVGFGNFAVEGEVKQAWKRRGRVLVTTSSGYLAYAARLLTQLSLLHKKSQCSRYGRRSEAVGIPGGEVMGQPQSFTGNMCLSTRFLSPGLKWITGPIRTTSGAIFHSFLTGRTRCGTTTNLQAQVHGVRPVWKV